MKQKNRSYTIGNKFVQITYKPIYRFKSLKEYVIFQSKNPLLLFAFIIFVWATIMLYLMR